MALWNYLWAWSWITKWLYHLDWNANDSSGNGVNGTATNIIWTWWIIWSWSASLTWTNSHIIINDALWLTTSSSNTLSFIIKSTSASWTQYITDWCTTSWGNRRIVLYSVSWILYIYSSWVSGSSTGLNIVNKILRISLVHTPSTDYVYVNSALLTSIAWWSIWIPYNQLWLWTPVDSTLVAQFIWIIDEAIVENRAWSATEIKKYYTYSKWFY